MPEANILIADNLAQRLHTQFGYCRIPRSGADLLVLCAISSLTIHHSNGGRVTQLVEHIASTKRHPQI